ncbi:MAG: GGDEF domain-containing protein [Burkholderiales bacterium]|nr:GGDEF domain-containing protein [Burkholderiales bacterium]
MTSRALTAVPGNLADAALAEAIARIEPILDSQPAAAIQLATAALDDCQRSAQTANPYLLGNLYCKLGYCRIALHDLMGIRDFEVALEYAEQSDDLALKAVVFHGLARTFIAFGDSQSALDYCERALTLGLTLDDEELLLQIRLSLAVVFALTQQFDRAIAINREVVEICQRINALACLSRALNNWADTLVSYFEHLSENQEQADVGLLEQAITYAQQAVLYAAQCNLPRTQLLALETLAHTLEQRGWYSLALEQLENGFLALSGRGFPKEELDIKVRIGALLLRMGQVDAAIFCLQEARDFAMQLGNYPHLTDLLKILSNAYEAATDFAAALQAYKEFHQVSLKARDQRAQISAQIFAAKMDLEHAQREAQVHKSRVNQLEDFNRSLRVQVHEDSLTGLPNRRALEAHMQQHLGSTRTEMSFVMADVDFFKHVNDRFSHMIGDQVLRIIGKLMRASLRSGDMAARIGGEEFALAINRTRERKSLEVCERLRKKIETYNWNSIAPDLRITMSFGVSGIRGGDDLSSVMQRADNALYRAKKNGRNRIERN